MDEMMFDSEVCCMVRSAAKRVTGGNATFIDDDIKILEHLASHAVAAGLVDELHPDVARAALNAAGGKQDA